MNIRDQIAAARALADAATKGPWDEIVGIGANRCIVVPTTPLRPQIDFDMTFIITSRTLVPQLADALERACELLEKQTGRKIGCECKTCDGDYRRAVDREIDAFLAGEVKP